MSFVRSIFAWANAPYAVALGVSVAFALLQTSGLLGLLAGADDADTDADADLEADAAAEPDADGHADADADGDGLDGVRGLLAGIGVGRMPLSLVWQSYAIAFALSGLAMSSLWLARTGSLPAWALVVTLPIAVSVGYAATRLVARTFGRLVSSDGVEATSRADLVGEIGTVISSRVDGAFGEIKLVDRSGHVLRLVCRVREGDDTIPEGRPALVVEWDRERDRLYVAPLEP